MTGKSRTKIITSVLLAVLLGINMAFYLNAIFRQERLTLPMILIAVILLVLSLVAIYGTYMRTLRKGHEQKLEGRYLELYERVFDYLALENISKKDRAEIQEEWLDIVISAQEEGREPETLYGNDFSDSMDQWVKEFGAPSRMISMLIDGVMFYCVFLIFLQGINFAKSFEVGFFGVAVPNSILIYIFLVTFVMVPFARRFQRQGNYVLYIGIPVVIFILYVAFSEGLHRFFGETAFSQWYNLGETQAIPSPMVLVILVCVAVISFFVKRIIRRPL
jgi:DNA-binding ferritin-like protein (Dps family)